MDDEEGFDIYEDLEQFDTKEKCAELQAAFDDLQVKYESACKEIEELKQKTQKYEVETKTMRRNFQSLLLTARAELTRKQTQIDNLQREKDNICFRRNQRQASQTPKTCPLRRKSPEIFVDLTNKSPDENEKVKQLHDEKSSQISNETQRMDSDPKENSTVNLRDIEQLDTNETVNKVDEEKREDSKQTLDKNCYRKEGRADYPKDAKDTANEGKLRRDNHDQKISTTKETGLSERVRIEKEAGHSHSKPSSDDRRNHTFQDKVEEGRLQTSSDERRHLTFKEKVEEGKLRRKNRFNPFKKQLSDESKEVFARGEQRPQTFKDIKEGCDEVDNKTNNCKNMKQSPNQDEWAEDRLSERYGRSKSSSITDWNQNENLTKFSKDREKPSKENKWLKERHVRTESESLKETAKQNWKEMRAEKDHSLKQSRSESKKENRSTSLKTVEDDWDQMDPIVTETLPENWRQNEGKRDFSQSTRPSDINKWEKDNLDAKRHQALLADWQSESDNSNDAKQPLNDDKGEYEKKRNRADGGQNQRVPGCSSKDMKHKLDENERKEDRNVRKKHQISKESPRLDIDSDVNKMGSSHRNEKPKSTYEPKGSEGKKETRKLDSAHKEIKTDQSKGKGPPDDKFDSSAHRRETHRHGRDRRADRGRTTERKDVKHSRTSQRSDSRTHSEKRDDKRRDVSETTSRRIFGNLEGEDRRTPEKKHYDKKERDDKTRQDRKDSSSHRKRKFRDEHEDRDRKRKKVNPRRSHSRSRTPQSKRDGREKDRDKNRASKEVKDETENRKQSRYEKHDGYKKRDKRSPKTEKGAHKKNHETTVNFEENTKNRICSPSPSEKVKYVTSDHFNSPLENKEKDDQLDLTELLKVQEALKSELEKESKKKTDLYSNHSFELIENALKCNQSADNFSSKEREEKTEIKKSATEQSIAEEAQVELNSIKEDAEPLESNTNVENGTAAPTGTQTSPSDNSEYASKAKKEEVEIYAREISNPQEKEPAADIGSIPNTTELQDKNELTSKTINEKITLDLPNLIDIGEEIKERDPFKDQTMEEPSKANEYTLKESEMEPVEVMASVSNVADEPTSKDVNSYEKNSFTLEDIEIGMENAATLETGENDSASKPFDACASSGISVGDIQQQLTNIDPNECDTDCNEPTSMENDFRSTNTKPPLDSVNVSEKAQNAIFQGTLKTDDLKGSESHSIQSIYEETKRQSQEENNLPESNKVLAIDTIGTETKAVNISEPIEFDNVTNSESPIKESQEVLREEVRTCTESSSDKNELKAFKINEINQETQKYQNRVEDTTRECNRKPKLESYLGENQQSDASSVTSKEAPSLEAKNMKTQGIDMPLLDFFAERPNGTQECAQRSSSQSYGQEFRTDPGDIVQKKAVKEKFGDVNLAAPESSVKSTKSCQEDISKSEAKPKEVRARKIDITYQDPRENEEKTEDTMNICDDVPATKSRQIGNQQLGLTSATGTDVERISEINIPVVDVFKEKPYELNEPIQSSLHQKNKEDSESDVVDKASIDKFRDKSNLAALDSSFGDVEAYDAIEVSCKNNPKTKEVGSTNQGRPKTQVEKTIMESDEKSQLESYHGGKQESEFSSAGSFNKNYAPSLKKAVSGVNISVIDISGENADEIYECVQSSPQQSNVELSKTDQVGDTPRNRSHEDKFKHVEEGLAAFESTSEDAEAHSLVQDFSKNKTQAANQGVSVICNSSRMPESEDIVSEIFGENEVPTTKSSVRVETIASKSAPVANTLLEHTFKSLEANIKSLGSGVKLQNVTEVFDIADGAERSDVVEKATHIRTASVLHNPGDMIKPVEANVKGKFVESSLPNSLANKEVMLSGSEAKVNQQDDSKTKESDLLQMIFVVIRNAIETYEEGKDHVKSDEIQTITTSIFQNIKELSLQMIEALHSAPKTDVNKVTKSVDAVKDSGIEATKCLDTSTVNSCIGKSTNQEKHTNSQCDNSSAAISSHKKNYKFGSRINVTDNAVADLMSLISVGVQNALSVHKRDGSHISKNNKTNPSTYLQEKNKIEQKTENVTNKVIQTPNLTNPTGHGEVMKGSCKEQTNTDKPRPVTSAGRRRSLTKESQKPEQPKLNYSNQNMLLNPYLVAMRQMLEYQSNQKMYPIPQQHPINPAFNIPQLYGSHNARESTNQNKVGPLPQNFHGGQNISGTAGKSRNSESLEAVLNNPSLSITGSNNEALGTSDSRGAGPKSLPWDAHLRNKIGMNEASNHLYPAAGPCSVNGLEMQQAFANTFQYYDSLLRMSQSSHIAPHIVPHTAPPMAPSIKASKRPRANSQFEELPPPPPPPQNMFREIAPNLVPTIQTMYNYQSNLMPYQAPQNLNTEPATKSKKNEKKGGTNSKTKQSTNVNLEKTANVHPMEVQVDPRLVNTHGKNAADFLEWGTFQNDLMAFQAAKHEATNQPTPSNLPQKKPRAPRKKKTIPLQEKIGEAEREVFVEKNVAIDLSMPTQIENLENVIDSLRTRNVDVNLEKADKSEGLEQTFSGVKTTHKVGHQSSEKETLIQSALLAKCPQETDELSIIRITSTNSGTETCKLYTQENRSTNRSEVDEKLKSTTNQEIEAKEPSQGKIKDTEYLSFASGLNSFSQKSRQSFGLNTKDSTHAKTEPIVQTQNYPHHEGEISHIVNDLAESRRKSVGMERYLTKKHKASFHREEVDENPPTVVVDLCESSEEENEDAFLTKKHKASMQKKAADVPTSAVEMQEGERNKQEDAAKITCGTDHTQNEKPTSPQNWGSIKPRKYATPTKKEKILSMTDGTYSVQHEVPSSMKKLNFPATETVVEQTNATNSDLGLKPIEPKGNEDVNCQISASREANLLREIEEQRISKREKEPMPVCKSKEVSPRTKSSLIGVPTQNEAPNFGDDIISTADEIILLLQHGQILEEFKKLTGEVNPEHQVKDRENLKRLNAPTSTNVEFELKKASIPEISKNSEKRDEGRAINDESKIIIIDDEMVSQDPLYTSTPLKLLTPPTKKLTNFPKEDSGLSTIAEDTMEGKEKTAMMSSIELTETVTLCSTKHLESLSLVNANCSERKAEFPAINDVSKTVLPQVPPITSTSFSPQTKKSSNFTKQASCCDDVSEGTEKASIISKAETTKKLSTKVVKNAPAKEVVTGRKPKEIGPATTSSHEQETFPSAIGERRDARKPTVEKNKNPLPGEANSDDILMREEDDFCSDKPVLRYETDTESASSDNVDVEKSLKKWVLMQEEFKGGKDQFKRSDVIVVSQSKSEENDKAKEIERKYNKIKSTFEPIERPPVVESYSKTSTNKKPSKDLMKGSSGDCGKKSVKEKKSDKKQKEYVSKSPAKEEQVIASADSTTSPKLTEKRIEDSWVYTSSSIDDPPFQNELTKAINAEQVKVRTSSRIKRKVNYCDFISDEFVTKRKRRASTYIQRSDVLFDESSSSSITTNEKIAKRRSSLNLTCETVLLLNSTVKKSTKSEINLEKSKSKQSEQKSEKGKETCIDKAQRKLGQNISHVLNLEEHAIFDVFPESIEKSVEKDPRKEKDKNSICHLESKKKKFEQLFGKSPTPKDSRFEDISLSSTQEFNDSQSNIGVKVDSTVNCPVNPQNETKNEATNISQNKENELKNSGQLNLSAEKVNISNSASNYTIEAVNENVTNVYITRKKVKKKKVRSS